MSQLSAHTVYATYMALDASQKEDFVQLMEEEKKKYSRKKKHCKSVYDKLPEKFHPDNIEMLCAEIMHE